MNAITRQPQQREHLLLFGVPFAVTLAIYALTMLNHVGPGSAGAWAAMMAGIGEPAGAVWSPLFKIVLRVLALVPHTWIEPHLLAGWITAMCMAVAAGFISLVSSIYQSKTLDTHSSTFAMMTGILAGMCSTVWAAALTINPAPLALALIAASLWWAVHDSDDKQSISAVLSFSLAVTAHIGALLLLPLLIWLIRRKRAASWKILAAVSALPLFLFLIPVSAPVFRTTSLFSQPTLVPVQLHGLGLLGWSLWSALTPVGLVFAIMATIWIVSERRLITPLLLALIPITAGVFIAPTSEFAAILAGIQVSMLALVGLALVFNRLPRGLGLVLWILVPVLLALRGPEISRHGEDLWEIHARNVNITQRYESLVMTTDHERILAPFLYLQAVRDLRSDLIVIDPTLLVDEKHFQAFDLDTFLQSDNGKSALSNLREAISSGDAEQIDAENSKLFFALVEEALDSLTSGVLISSDIHLGPAVGTVPEGLLWRITNEDGYPFAFDGLDLGPIAMPKHDDRPLVASTIESYARMFTARAEFLSQDKLTTRAADYIRWALLVDPGYEPARQIATEFNINGDPLQLRPKTEPRKAVKR